MKHFLALTLCLVAVASYSQATSVAELIQIAEIGGVPFTQVALDRMNNRVLWGAQRAYNTIDVVIMNKSGKSYRLTSSRCFLGSFSLGLYPEFNLLERTSSVFGVQSSSDNPNLGCVLNFMHPQSGTYFRITLTDTKTGENTVYANYSHDLEIIDVIERGANSQVRIIVNNRNGGGLLSTPSQQDETLVPQIKLKGSRNMFVKASKNGSSVRSI